MKSHEAVATTHADAPPALNRVEEERQEVEKYVGQ